MPSEKYILEKMWRSFGNLLNSTHPTIFKRQFKLPGK
jgi:hypothetical protein